MLTTIHAQRYDGWMGDWLREMQPTWAKIVNPPAGFVPPNVANSLVRIWTDDIDQQYISRGRVGGRDFVRMMLPRWQQNPATCYSLWNEPAANGNENLALLREATLGAVEEAAHLGIQVGVMDVAEGNPHNDNTGNEAATIWKWQQLRPAIKAAADLGFPFLRHCYWRPGVEGPSGRWHALGRLAWDLETLNIPNLRTLVTECGIDGGIAGYPGKEGWQRLTTEALYRGEINEAERYARTLPGVEALMYFGFGAINEWLAGGFDIPEVFARSLVAPLKALTPPAVEVPEDTEAHLRIELLRPIAYTAATNKVTQWFGENPAMYTAYGLAGHNGLDYRAPIGTPVRAAHPGIVRCYDQGAAGYGKYVMVDNARYWTLDGHLSEFKVRDGQRVNRGAVIGLSGNTGNSTGAHVHFGLMVVGMDNPAYRNWIDPAPWRTVDG